MRVAENLVEQVLSGESPTAVAGSALDEQRYAVEPGGLRGLETGTFYLAPMSEYWLGVSTSPKHIIVTKVDDRMVRYVSTDAPDKEVRVDRDIAEDLIYRGTRTQLAKMRRHMSPGLVRTLENNLDGIAGPLNGKARPSDWVRYQVDVRPAAGVEADRLWNDLEKGGYSVLGTVDDPAGETLVQLWAYERDLDDLKRDRRFEIIKMERER